MKPFAWTGGGYNQLKADLEKQDRFPDKQTST